MFVAHNGVFMEKEFLSKGVSGSKVQLEEICDRTTSEMRGLSPKIILGDSR
jgi:hypothetical protein